MPAKKKTTKTNQSDIPKRGDVNYMQPDTLKIMQLMDKDIKPEDAVKLVKGKDIIHRNTKGDLKKKHARYSLTKPNIVKLAHQAVKDTLKMTEVIDSEGKVSLPSHTNRLAAASMVMDRVEPVVKVNHNLNVNANVDPVDLSVYMTKPCG